MTVDTRTAQFSVAQLTVSATATYYNPATGAWQATAPTVSRGATICVRVRMTNTSGYTLWMRPEVRFRRPDGTTLGIAGFDNQVASGSYSEQDFFITADQVGTYQHNLAVYVGMWQDAMSLTISWPWTDAAIVAAVAMGTITAVQYRHPTTGAWGTTAPAYVMGHTLEVRALGRNESGVPMTAWIDLDITDPDGTKTTLSGEAVVQPAGETWTWPFTRELNKVGTWSLAFKYYGEV